MNPEKPVMLVHGYWFGRKGVRPDTFGRLQVLAACELLRQGEIERIVFTSASSDKNGHQMAEVMANQASRNLPKLAKDRIIASACGPHTRGEVSEFKKIAEAHGWDNLVSLGSEKHTKRIKKANWEIFYRDIPVLKTEEVLTRDILIRRYRKIVYQFRRSREVRELQSQEYWMNKIDQIPLSGALLDIIARLAPGTVGLKAQLFRWWKSRF